MAWTRRTEKHHGYSDGYEAMVVNSIVDAVRAIKAHRRCGKNWCEDIPGKCSIPAHRCAASSWRFFESLRLAEMKNLIKPQIARKKRFEFLQFLQSIKLPKGVEVLSIVPNRTLGGGS